MFRKLVSVAENTRQCGTMCVVANCNEVQRPLGIHLAYLRPYE